MLIGPGSRSGTTKEKTLIRALSIICMLGISVLTVAPVRAQSSTAPLERALAAADRAEITELSARFDNSLDSGDADKFVSTFVSKGELVGFWGVSRGPDQIRQAHAFMLATFARDKRHVVTNHEIVVSGDSATMFCYLVVFDRLSLAVTGTATFTDELSRTEGEWKFVRRTLDADPNVNPIIEQLKASMPAEPAQ